MTAQRVLFNRCWCSFLSQFYRHVRRGANEPAAEDRVHPSAPPRIARVATPDRTHARPQIVRSPTRCGGSLQALAASIASPDLAWARSLHRMEKERFCNRPVESFSRETNRVRAIPG